MVPGGSSGEVEKSGGGTVVVGVKLDSQSRELLTWALVKVAQPGDRVIALHVLGHNGKYGLSTNLFIYLFIFVFHFVGVLAFCSFGRF